MFVLLLLFYHNNQDQAKYWDVYPANVPSAIISDLEPGVEYSIDVMSINNMGESNFTLDPVIVRTSSKKIQCFYSYLLIRFVFIYFFCTFHTTEAPSGIWIDGFKAFLGGWKLPYISAIQCQNMSFYWIYSNIDGFKNLSLKIDGFGRTHRTHADEAPN